MGALTENTLSKKSNFNEIVLEFTYFKNIYFFNNIFQEIDQSILSFKFCGLPKLIYNNFSYRALMYSLLPSHNNES